MSERLGTISRRLTALAVIVCCTHMIRAKEPQRTSERTPAKTQVKNDAPNEVVDQQFPELGVIAAETPGSGLRIVAVAPGSPADLAGVAPDDYLLSVNGSGVSSFDELRKLIHSKRPGQRVEVKLWRIGKATQRTIALATKLTKMPVEEDGAWIGVVLVAGDQSGAEIGLVHPLGPAHQAGLRPGDRIVGIDGKKIESVTDAVGQLEKLQPYSTVDMMVSRQGREERLTVLLGSAAAASDEIVRHPGWLPEPADRLANQESLSDVVQQLRDELKALREEVRLLGKVGAVEQSAPKNDSAGPVESRHLSPVVVNPGSGDVLAQYGPYTRSTVHRFHNYQYQYPISPSVQPYSYFYYRKAPYYSNYSPPYAYPYAIPNLTPGAEPRVAPDIYLRSSHRWH